MKRRHWLSLGTNWQKQTTKAMVIDMPKLNLPLQSFPVCLFLWLGLINYNTYLYLLDDASSVEEDVDDDEMSTDNSSTDNGKCIFWFAKLVSYISLFTEPSDSPVNFSASKRRRNVSSDKSEDALSPRSKRLNSLTLKAKKIHKCPICGKIISSGTNLTKHINGVHNGVKPHECKECQKGFKSKWHLVQHMRSHTGEKPFTCPLCRKSFSQMGTVTKHIDEVHNGVKPHECKECQKGFKSKWHLVQHMRSHTGEKPFTCHLCHRSFSLNTNLTMHINAQHKHNKKYKCYFPLCGNDFQSKQGLERHLSTHSGEKRIACEGCGKRFKNKSSMDSHKQLYCKANKAINQGQQKPNLRTNGLHSESTFWCPTGETSTDPLLLGK